MCIAIPSPQHRGGRSGASWWRWLTASPARLLGFSSALQLVGLALSSTFFGLADSVTALTPALFVALSTLLLGLSMARAPLRLGALPFSYPLLMSLFLPITAGGLLALLPSWTVAGQALVLAGWFIGLRALWWKLKWAPSRLSRTVSTQSRVLVAVAAALGGMLLALLLGSYPIASISA